MNIFKYITCALAIGSLCLSTCFTNTVLNGSAICYAERDYMQEWEERKSLPVESNNIQNWPQGPAIGAECAILMDMDTHTVLYSKNIHQKMYPASTTKILTCLLAMENCTLNEELTFSYDSIHSVPLDGSRLGGVNEGDKMKLEYALYSVLVQSANDVANAVGEHVAQKLGYEKTSSEFAKLMTNRAKELGCKNTKFANPSGLFDENHYTTAYDLALIGCEFFDNNTLCKMSSTPSYHIEPNQNQTEDMWMASKNQLLKGKPYEYEYLLGSKTGFVSQSRQTLVSAAKKDNMRLVCVVFTEETPYQFEDTVSLFKYGFENFKKVSINDNETKYNISDMDLFNTDNNLFGDSSPLIALENNRYVTIPKNAAFKDMDSSLTYHEDANGDSNIIATINYSYFGADTGTCNVLFQKNDTPSFDFSSGLPSSLITSNSTATGTANDSQKIIFINVKKLIIVLIIISALILLILFISSVIKNYKFSPKGQSSRRRNQRRHDAKIARKRAKMSAKRYKNQLITKNKKQKWTKY